MVTQASDGGRIAPVSAHAAPPADHSAAARARALICGRARRRTPRGKAPRPYGWPDHKPSSLPRRSRFPRQRNARPNSARIQPTRALHRSRRAAIGRANAESVGQGQVSVLSDERQALFSLSSAWKSSVLLRRLILITCPAGTRVPYDSYRHWLWLLLPRPDGGWSRAGLLRRSSETERPGSARNSGCPLLRYQPFTTGRGEVQRATRCQLRTGCGRRSRNGSAANGDACPKVPENAALSGAPGRSRTCGPRLRRPKNAVSTPSSSLQALATTRDHVGSDSSQSQVLAPFTEDFADRLRTLLSVRDVAERLAVSTKTVYALYASGTLRHFRVLNAIRVAP